MKKMIAVLLTLILALCPAAFAEEAAAAEINWEEIADQAADIVAQGEFVTLDEIAVQLWIPAVMPAVELTEEDTEAGYIAYFCTEDEAYAIAVQYVDVDGMALEDYAASLEEYGATEIEAAVLNGMDAISYKLEETDTVCVAFATEMGYILEVAMSPISDEGFAPIASVVSASIQPAEGLEEDAEGEEEEAEDEEAEDEEAEDEEEEEEA